MTGFWETPYGQQNGIEQKERNSGTANLLRSQERIYKDLEFRYSRSNNPDEKDLLFRQMQEVARTIIDLQKMSQSGNGSRERIEVGGNVPFRIIWGKDGSYSFINARYSQLPESTNVWRYEVQFEKQIKKYLTMPELRTFDVVYHPESNSAEIISNRRSTMINLPVPSRHAQNQFQVNIDGMELVIEIMR